MSSEELIPCISILESLSSRDAKLNFSTWTNLENKTSDAIVTNLKAEKAKESAILPHIRNTMPLLSKLYKELIGNDALTLSQICSKGSSKI
jgi:hypothetical protein